MKITRLKLWTFCIELDSGQAYTVNRRGDVWCFGPAGGATTHEAESLLGVLGIGLRLKPLVPKVIDGIVELLVTTGFPESAQATPSGVMPTEVHIIGPHHGHGPTTVSTDKQLLAYLRQRGPVRLGVAPCPVAGKPEHVPDVGALVEVRRRHPGGAYSPVLFQMRVESREDVARPRAAHDGAILTLRRTNRKETHDDQDRRDET